MLFLFVASTKSNFRYISTRKLVLLHFLAIIIDEFSILRNSLVYSTLKKHQKWQKMKKSLFFFKLLSAWYQFHHYPYQRILQQVVHTLLHTEYNQVGCIAAAPKKIIQNNIRIYLMLEFQESQLQIYQIFVMSFPKKKIF